jgi:FtsP/CotA-like multicopper oxidase with cupredoxin domain
MKGRSLSTTGLKRGTSINRRDFLRVAGISAAALMTNAGAPATASGRSMPLRAHPGFIPDVEVGLRAAPAEVSLFSGQPTSVWTYEGLVLQGDPASLQVLPNSYLGPIIRVRRGQNVRINFTNGLAEESIIHWHGLHLPPDMDAHPRYAISAGQTYVYDLSITNRAGTYWYHPHPDGRTGPQVYNGLAGLLIVSDDEEAALGLPSGDYDLPMVIQDRSFDSNNQLVYSRNGMMNNMDGFLGDRILINGRPGFTLTAARRSYRLRLLNGSNSRIYKLAWDDGTPLTVIASDGGLLEAPVQRSYVMLAPGERVELLADFSTYPVGARLRLVSLQFSAADGGGMGGAHTLPNGAPFLVMSVHVRRKRKAGYVLPGTLSTLTRYKLADAANSNNPRSFAISSRMMTWLLNGRTFEMDGVAPNEIVQLGTLEAWELINQPSSGGMMGGMMGGMRMAHPIHIHGLQFQVIERQVSPQFAEAWETVRYGYVDEGWKDTVMLMPGERVKLLLKFEDHTGLYVYHCHNLEHEDNGMMRNYLVRA